MSPTDNRGQTIWSALKPVHEALGSYHIKRPIESGIENLYLMPGDIRLSRVRDGLGGVPGRNVCNARCGDFAATTAVRTLPETSLPTAGFLAILRA